MSRVENTVFISYRRSNFYSALAVAQYLSSHNYDVFLDYKSIDNGDFEQIIFNSIESRAHFLVLLTPSALERCNDPKDWMRREMEHAIKHQRNIVPLTFEGFVYEDLAKQLPPHLADPLSHYNAVRVVSDYFDAAMEKLRNQFLNKPLETVIHPKSTLTDAYEGHQRQERQAAPTVSQDLRSAEEYFERGNQFREQNRLADALSDYNRALDLAPDHSWAYNNRGVVYRAMGNSAEGIRNYTRAIELEPEFAMAYNNRGNAYSDLGDYDAALRDYNRAIELDPEYAKAYDNRGVIHTYRQDYLAAIKDHSRAIDLNPFFANAYSNRAVAYRRRGQYPEAVRDASRAIELDPADPLAYINRGTANLNNGNQDAAFADFNHALDLDPNSAIANNNRGVIHERRGEYEAAIRDHRRAIELDPSYANAHNNLGVALMGTQDYEAAIQAFERALQLNPRHPFAADNIRLAEREIQRKPKRNWRKNNKGKFPKGDGSGSNSGGGDIFGPIPYDY